jgi:hypothetical protein
MTTSRRELRYLPLPLLVGAALAAAVPAAQAHADYWEPTPPTVPFSPSPLTGDKAQTVVSNLQSNGYKVILNRIGAAPLDQCVVTSVTPGQQITTPVTAGAASVTNQVLFTTVYVTADCTTHTK